MISCFYVYTFCFPNRKVIYVSCMCALISNYIEKKIWSYKLKWQYLLNHVEYKVTNQSFFLSFILAFIITHIFVFPELFISLYNVRLLCSACHYGLHFVWHCVQERPGGNLLTCLSKNALISWLTALLFQHFKYITFQSFWREICRPSCWGFFVVLCCFSLIAFHCFSLSFDSSGMF